MIDYTLLTVISITALVLAVLTFIFVITLNTYLDRLHDYLEDVDVYTDTLSHKIADQRADFNRSLLTAERKEKELYERMNILQCRLNQDRMQGIIDGKIKE